MSNTYLKRKKCLLRQVGKNKNLMREFYRILKSEFYFLLKEHVEFFAVSSGTSASIQSHIYICSLVLRIVKGANRIFMTMVNSTVCQIFVLAPVIMQYKTAFFLSFFLFLVYH